LRIVEIIFFRDVDEHAEMPEPRHHIGAIPSVNEDGDRRVSWGNIGFGYGGCP